MTSYKSPALCPETESNERYNIKKLGLFKATPGILSVSVKGGLPIKSWTSLRGATGMTRAEQADRCQPGTGTPPVLWAISSLTDFLLASAPSVPVSTSTTGPSHTEEGSNFLLVNSCKTLEPWARTSRGYSHTGKCPGHLHIQISHQLPLFA